MIRSVRSSRTHNRKLPAKALACGSMLFLTSCHIPELRGPCPARCVPDDFNGTTTSDNSACVGFEEFFNDPILTDLILQGISGNQELRILYEQVQIANNEILRRRGAIFPFVNLGTGASLEKTSRFTRNGAVESQLNVRPGHGFPDPLPNFMVGANVSWEVDIWRALRNARDASTLRYLGTNDGRNYVVTRLVAEIAERYYELMALDKRLEVLDATIALQEQSLQIAIAKKENARGTELAVQRFRAELAKNTSEKLIVRQEIIETENRINFLLGRYPQPVERTNTDFINLALHSLSVGVPCQLLQNRPDIRQAERELQAAGLDIAIARAAFYPRLTLTGGVGYEAFNPRYIVMTPESAVASIAGDLVAPIINRTNIQADFMNANAIQLQRLYDYQRVVLNAFTEVINRITAVQNYSQSIEIKKQQLTALESSVEQASQLFQNARVEYIEVLFAQRDLQEARTVTIQTKQKQLAAIVNAYQALGGGLYQYSCYGPGGEPNEAPLPSPTRELEESPMPTPVPAPAPAPADPALPTPATSSSGRLKTAPASPDADEEQE
ncbi:MAG TPA: efflux transporter outer membrane subunit [Caulifigura sp.]|nr:efflux transporter outer membrane subunit [Caulifigura sp.]